MTKIYNCYTYDQIHRFCFLWTKALDAQIVEAYGADGVIFSNHEGRQLGQAIPNLQIMAEIMLKL